MSGGFNYRRFYNRIAAFYATVIARIPVWRRYTEAALPWLPPQGTILEIGPGPGVLHQQLVGAHPFVMAVDLSPGMLRQTRRRLQRAGLGRAAHLAQANAVRLPVAAQRFDGVALTFVFTAIPDGAAAMAEIARVLKPGGVVALVDACDPSNGNRIGRGMAWLWERFGDFMRDEAALMRAAGLDVIECREFGAFDGIRITVGRKPVPA